VQDARQHVATWRVLIDCFAGERQQEDHRLCDCDDATEPHVD
jgi:hypothetical protein